MNSTARKLVRSLERQGWRWSYTGTGHVRLVAPNGRSMTMAATPSDQRALLNIRADIRRILSAPPVKGRAVGSLPTGG